MGPLTRRGESEAGCQKYLSGPQRRGLEGPQGRVNSEVAELLEFSRSLEAQDAGPHFGDLRSATNGFDHPTSGISLDYREKDGGRYLSCILCIRYTCINSSIWSMEFGVLGVSSAACATACELARPIGRTPSKDQRNKSVFGLPGPTTHRPGTQYGFPSPWRLCTVEI